MLLLPEDAVIPLAIFLTQAVSRGIPFACAKASIHLMIGFSHLGLPSCIYFGHLLSPFLKNASAHSTLQSSDLLTPSAGANKTHQPFGGS